jgi:predicted TIM-barrel fold metal-dependent hydrolase
VHAHVFGPYDAFPLAGDRTYTPPAAPLELYLHMLDRVGFERGVLVHASAYGLDCSALMHALAGAGERLRGVAVATSATTDADLERMRSLGVRGLRFSQFDDPAQQARFKNSIGFDQLVLLGPRLRAIGLHAQIWADCASFVRAAPRLLALGLPLVLDHMGHFDVARGTGDAAFQALLGLLSDDRIWVKLSANRNTKRFPNFEDVRPFHDALLSANPARLLWGSDWPFLGMGETTPDVGELIDRFDAWTGDEALRHRILVSNPAALYGWREPDDASP